MRYNWAATWQSQQSDCAPSERSRSAWASAQSDQSVCCPREKAWVLSFPLSAQRRLWSDWADAQADLSLRWAHSHFVGLVMRRLELMHKTYNFSTLCEYSGEMLSLRTCKYKTGRTGFVLIVIIGQVRRVYKSITVEICQFLARPLHDCYI